MTRGSAQFYPTQGTPKRLLLTLPASKTDPFRRGITLTIAAAGDSACAVTALYHLVTTWRAGPRAPLYALSHFSSKPWPSIPRPPLGGIQAAESTTTRGRTQELLWSLLSLGRSHMGKQVGSPDEDIQLLGRWKSSAYKRYIEIHPEHIFGISRRLQTSPSPGPLRAVVNDVIAPDPRGG